MLNEEKRTRLEILQKYQDEASTLDQEVEKAMVSLLTATGTGCATFDERLHLLDQGMRSRREGGKAIYPWNVHGKKQFAASVHSIHAVAYPRFYLLVSVLHHVRCLVRCHALCSIANWQPTPARTTVCACSTGVPLVVLSCAMLLYADLA